jgi:hemoglobin
MPDSDMAIPLTNASEAFRSRAAETGITKQLIQNVVLAFYDKVRKDAVLGPIFLDAIGDDWDAHIERIMSFWLTATRLDRGYDGRRFMPAHLKHRSIRPRHLGRWLTLFHETLDEQCSPQQAAALIDIAKRMAENIGLGLAKRDRASLPRHA